MRSLKPAGDERRPPNSPPGRPSPRLARPVGRPEAKPLRPFRAIPAGVIAPHFPFWARTGQSGLMDAFPAFIPLAGRRVVVVGDGEMADAKARLFAESPAEVIRAPQGDAGLEVSMYRGAALVFIASEDAEYAAAAAAAARSAGALLVNVVDRPALCDFYTPALVDRGAVVAAVGTTGSGPLLAQRLKEEIDRMLPRQLGTLAMVLKTVQPLVRQAFPDFTRRRAFLTSLLDGPAAAAALEGDAVLGEQLAREALEASVEADRGLVKD